MKTHLIYELEKLKQQIFSIVSMVEENLSLALNAVKERDKTMALQAMSNDNDVDNAEISVEEECLKLLALYQPVAIDLRFIIAVLKLNNDLERIGDLAVNIAENAHALSDLPPVPLPFDFDDMAAKATAMLKNSLDSLVNSDVPLALKVCEADDEVDMINSQMFKDVKQAIHQHPEHIGGLIHLLSVSRHLERVADHATNIAEDVIYLVKGEIVRHAPEISLK